MPSTWEIAFSLAQPQYVHPSGVHAFLARVFNEGTEHKVNQPKPYSLVQIRTVPDHAIVTLSFIDDRLAMDLEETVAPGMSAVFGRQSAGSGEVAEVPRLITHSSWDGLIRIDTPDAWALELQTPTCFRRGNASTPWPSPEHILESLARSWRQGSRSELPFALPAVSSILVRWVELHSQVVKASPKPMKGSTGRLEWEWAPHPKYAPDREGAAAVTSLLALAEFAGVGAYTQFGLGRVLVFPLERVTRR